MKLLELTHGRFTQTDSEYLIQFAPDYASSNNQLRHAKSQHIQDKSYVSQPEIFQGFQTIRTVEKDLAFTDLETQNIAMHVESMTKNKTRTEDVLKRVNEKLEKLLSFEDNTNNEAIANPLQHYVVNSKVGLAQTTRVKDHRTSLLELFQKTEASEEKNDHKSNIRHETEKKSANSGKMMLKKKSTVAPVAAIDSASADEKLHKTLSKLHRVYPEASAISQQSQTRWKYATNSNCVDEDIITFPIRAISKTSANDTKSKVCNPIYNDTNWKREHWIKSDAEFLILELKNENDAIWMLPLAKLRLEAHLVN